jgi:hypothetical protein
MRHECKKATEEVKLRPFGTVGPTKKKIKKKKTIADRFFHSCGFYF